MQIPIFQIKVADGRREASPEAVRELADSIAKVGLLNPITVDQEYTLIAGLHRLEAAKLLGWSEIECNVSSLEGLMAQLAEIDENIVRKGFSDDEYDEMLLRRKEIYETLHPETKHGGDRKSGKIKVQNLQLDSAKSFIQDTADKTGMAPRTVAARLQTAKNLIPEAKAIIRNSDTKVTRTSALKLSRLPPEQQEDAARQLASKAIRSVDDYRPAQPEPKPPDGPETAPYTGETALLPETRDPPDREGCRYSTFKESVEDLKNPNKDRRRTPDTFLTSVTFFLRKFCQNVRTYADVEYETAFPELTPEHLDLLCQEISSAHTALDQLLHMVEKKSRKEKEVAL